MPSDKDVARWLASTPRGFTFHVKAFSMLADRRCPVGTLPWQIRNRLAPAVVAAGGNIEWDALGDELQRALFSHFNSLLAPLWDVGKLGVVLFQASGAARTGGSLVR